MKLAPQTRSADVVHQINDILSEGSYANAQAWNMRMLKRECERIRDVDALAGWSLLGSYYGLLGDVDEAERCFSASLKLGKDPITLGNYYAMLVNLGYFSKAHEHFWRVGKPELGALSVLNEYVDGMGSFQTAAAYNKEAGAMGIQLQYKLSDAFMKGAEILARAGISDEQVVRHMDAAGIVLRRNRLFYDEAIRVAVSDVDGVFVGVTCVLGVSKSPMEVFEMNVELAMAEEEIGVQKHPVFDVMFKPV